MRHIQGYTWETILNEEVRRTMVTIHFLNKEKEAERKEYEKASRRGRRR